MSVEHTQQKQISYLDFAASAPLRDSAAQAEYDYEHSVIAGANPNSLHTLGRSANAALDQSRRELALCLGGGFRPDDIVFTSGGTESNNMAVLGIALAVRAKNPIKTTVVISAIEHDSILNLEPALKERGFTVKRVYPNHKGLIAPQTLDAVLDSRVALVCIMAANNETGVIQPIAECAKKAHAVGAFMHSDAVQAFARVPLDFSLLDSVSIAGHKIGAPVGIGALAIRRKTPFFPQNFGGGQERKRRSGTQPLRAALAFAAAARECRSNLEEYRSQTAQRAQALYDLLLSSSTRIHPVGSQSIDEKRLPGIVSFIVSGFDSHELVLRLDEAGFEVSAGSACAATSTAVSHVLLAMGFSRAQAEGFLRISFDERVEFLDLERCACALLEIIGNKCAKKS